MLVGHSHVVASSIVRQCCEKGEGLEIVICRRDGSMVNKTLRYHSKRTWPVRRMAAGVMYEWPPQARRTAPRARQKSSQRLRRSVICSPRSTKIRYHAATFLSGEPATVMNSCNRTRNSSRRPAHTRFRSGSTALVLRPAHCLPTETSALLAEQGCAGMQENRTWRTERNGWK